MLIFSPQQASTTRLRTRSCTSRRSLPSSRSRACPARPSPTPAVTVCRASARSGDTVSTFLKKNKVMNSSAYELQGATSRVQVSVLVLRPARKYRLNPATTRQRTAFEYSLESELTGPSGSSLVDSFVWVKPGGESDGTSDPSAKRYDSFCGYDDAFKPSPEAGQVRTSRLLHT
jgi:hypothetical protein